MTHKTIFLILAIAISNTLFAASNNATRLLEKQIVITSINEQFSEVESMLQLKIETLSTQEQKLVQKTIIAFQDKKNELVTWHCATFKAEFYKKCTELNLSTTQTTFQHGIIGRELTNLLQPKIQQEIDTFIAEYLRKIEMTPAPTDQYKLLIKVLLTLIIQKEATIQISTEKYNQTT